MKRVLIAIGVLVLGSALAPAQDWASQRLEASPRHQEWVEVNHGRR